ncbi:hypothetical protein HYY71_02795 [Candidatus Woesearchaeota archaeon]|nr:hypothetical protein [Candidatus Woesearchaeota archaeon]
MRFQKAIKRMIALGTGAIMVGSSVFAAADLAQYPNQFIKDGKFVGVLVVGDRAAAEDVIGISDIVASLQFAATKKVATTSAGAVSVEGDAWQVKTSNNLELSEDSTASDVVETLRNITSYIDKSNLKALAAGNQQ